MAIPMEEVKKPSAFELYITQTNSSGNSIDEKHGSSHLEQVITTLEAQPGNNALFDANGNIIYQPAKTRDPKDPINMTFRHKMLCMISLCFFGALAAAAELILGAMLPVFALEYAHIDPKLLLPWTENPNFLAAGSDPLSALDKLGGPPIQLIYLLSSLPVLVIGISNLILIPLAISMGRRFIILSTGVLAIGGCLWAGNSQSLTSHLLARCVQAIGAGTIESLIPFMVQDMVHIHERNTWISGVFAAQGIIIIALGFAATHIIIYLSWRWVYFLTAAGAGFFLIGCVFFMPETRYPRTRAEMEGIPREDAGVEYSPRTWAWDLALFHGNFEWRKGWLAFVNTMRTFFYPQIFFITMLHSATMATLLAAAYTVSANLLVKPWAWSFLNLGYCLVPVLIAAICVGIVSGTLADRLANFMARRRGARLPENQLINLAIPFITAIAGCVLFGITGEDPEKYHWAWFLLGLGLLAFGFLGSNTVGSVYVLETYPHLAGPSLVNIASFRCLLAFVFSFRVSEWVATLGYGTTMNIYTGILCGFALLVPVVYVYGPAWKRRWPANFATEF